MNVSKSVLLAALVLSSASCHARFKKFARSADMVDLKVVVSGAAVVNLEESGGNQSGTLAEGLIDAGVGAVAQAEGAKVRARVEKALQPQQVQAMVQQGAVAMLADGPPFASGGTPIDGTIQIEVLNYGIVQSGGGPNFFVDYRIRGYRAADNKRIYKHGLSCTDRAFHTPNTVGNIAGTVMTINHLNKMSDEELSATLSGVVQRCTGRVIADMRRHAG